MSKVMKDDYDIDDLEAFIQGLKDTIDSLGEENPENTQGFQLKLAKAISTLRSKKMAKITPAPRFDKQGKLLIRITKEDLKNFLLNELEFLTSNLDSVKIRVSRKFDLVMKIAKLRDQIKNL